MATTEFSIERVMEVCRALGIDLATEDFDAHAVRRGMNVELEHGTRNRDLDVTGDDPILTAKLAIAHLRELPDYYSRLDRMRRLAEAHWAVEREPGLGIIGPAHRPTHSTISSS